MSTFSDEPLAVQRRIWNQGPQFWTPPSALVAILAIDPGPTESAYVSLEVTGRIVEAAKVPNEQLLQMLRSARPGRWDAIAVEMIASYGMPVGAEVFETCVVIGRICEALRNREPIRVERIEVKSAICHSGKANDANIRQALIDRYGGKDKAIGKKATPGPLYGISGDMWAALAVAVTVQDRMQSGSAAA